MRIPVVLLSFLAVFTAVSQSSIIYKPADASSFEKGDRIAITGVEVFRITPEKDSVSFPAGPMEQVRKAVQEHPLVAFRLNFYWKSKGVKYPGTYDFAKDSLLSFLNQSADSSVFISQFKHTFAKQEEPVKVELEVLGVLPVIYLGTIKLKDLAQTPVDVIGQQLRFTAKYPQSSPESVISPTVKEVHFLVGSKDYILLGSEMNSFVKDFIERAPRGTKVKIVKTIVNTSSGILEVNQSGSWIKTTGPEPVIPKEPKKKKKRGAK